MRTDRPQMNDRLYDATRVLIARFRRQRPVRTGSLLITLLGDAVAPRGGVITLGSLIRLAQPFGITERLARTSVGRLAQEGWLSSRRQGRQSEYFLSEHGRQRFTEATGRIYGAGQQSWDSTWTLVLLSVRARERIRDEMRWLGFGQLSAGILAHPGRSTADTRAQLKELGIDGDTVLMRASSEGAAADRKLVAAGWDLAELGRSYRRFVGSFSGIRSLLAGQAAPPPETAFVIRTLLIHEYRKIHLRDPLLPQALLPQHWIGTVAYELCGDLYRRVFAAAESHLSEHAMTFRGRLAAPSHETHGRFGGLDAAQSP